MDNFKNASERTGDGSGKRALATSGTIQDWVVGRRFYAEVAVKKGDAAIICREPTNTHDPNAFAVFKDNTLIGYLPASMAAYLAPLFDQKLLKLEGWLEGGDTPDGCAPIKINVLLTNPTALALAAKVKDEPDKAFPNIFAAWRDRGEYDLPTLQKFCAKGGKSKAGESEASQLLYRLLTDYCTEQAKHAEDEAEPRAENPAIVAKRKLFFDFLKVEGYVPDIDGDGDIHFKYEGGHYYISIGDPDPEFFRIIYPQFWSIDSDQEFEAVLRAASRATERTKVAKVFPLRNETWASIEIFVSKPEDVKPLFGRLMRALKCAIDTFGEEMRRQQEGKSDETD